MRDFKGMKRQRGRNRGSSGGQPKHNANRSFDSNGPEGIKVRGAAQGVFEKYQQLARDAASAGDRVLAENYLQHAEHYFRVVRAMQPTRPASDIIGKEGLSGGFDIDFEAEPEEATVETAEGGENSGEGEGGEQQSREPRSYDNNNNNNGRRDDRQDRPRFDNQRQDRNTGGANNDGNQQPRRDRWRDRDDRPRDDRPRDDRPRDDRPRDDRPRDDRPRDDRPRDDRPRDDRPRDDRPRDDRPRDDRPREQTGERVERSAEREGGRRDRFERGDRPEREPRDPLAVVEPQATPLAAPAASRPPEEVVRAPRRAPRVAEEASASQLRGQDGTVSEAPAFLSRAPAPAAAPTSDDAEAPKPRRGRPKKAAPESEDA